MRKGQNPAKFVKDVPHPERITVALLNYIPFLSGFYAETLDVLKVCLNSIHKDAGLPFDLMVFDNGSCSEVRDFLVSEKGAGRIQYLILSDKNVGKGGAWNVMLPGAPGEIITYTDSDVLSQCGHGNRAPIPYTARVLFRHITLGEKKPKCKGGKWTIHSMGKVS